MLSDNLKQVESRIQKACEKTGRKREEITLIAVSKTKPIPMLDEIYAQGIRDFGENKVQELSQKHVEMPADIRWHMIGHLQRNKVKQVISKAALIHSVDSLRLAEEIEKEAQKQNLTVEILLEVNIAEEESKYGFKAHEIMNAIESISKFTHLKVMGLMTIAPYVENAEENRAIFATLRKLSVDIRHKNIDNISVDILSMGMTNDFEVAIEEGATMIRVGTAIFGEREYQI